MRRAARTDKTHRPIVTALRKLGYRVFDTSAAGDGFPDMVVPLRNGRVAMLFENKPEEGGKVTPDEMRFMLNIVESVYRMVDGVEQVNAILQKVESE